MVLGGGYRERGRIRGYAETSSVVAARIGGGGGWYWVAAEDCVRGDGGGREASDVGGSEGRGGWGRDEGKKIRWVKRQIGAVVCIMWFGGRVKRSKKMVDKTIGRKRRKFNLFNLFI
jgi:hypothetical protein